METRICKKCKTEFKPTNSMQRYCKQIIYSKCEVCGKDIQYLCGDFPKSTCSKECMTMNNRRKNLEKYGVDNPAKLQSSKDKAKATILERYGSESYTGTLEYREKTKQTCLRKYGTTHHLKSAQVINKRRETVQSRYGVDNVFQSEEIKDRSRRTLQERYGVESNISQSSEIQSKIASNNVEKYGVTHPMMLPEYKAKAERTTIQRYGRKAYTQQHIENIELWYEFMNNPREYISKYHSEKVRSSDLAKELGVDLSTIDVYLSKNDCYDLIKNAKSMMEKEISEFIHKERPDVSIINNARNRIDHYELDIYIPELSIAIECNPTATHNSSTSDPWGGEPKSISYHKIKTDKCEEKGIFLFHIFGYEWTHKRDIIESMMRNILQCNNTKIYARKCEIKEVSGSEARIFLNANHRQGSVDSKIRLGLYYKSELVSLMTFGKMRRSIGTGREDLSNCYELVRFCSKLNTTVVGGADKLFKHFVRTHSPERVRSFSDRAHTRGKLYENLGFTEIRRSEANYVWVDSVTDTAYHRTNAQKANISKFLKDDSIDLSQSEKQIMESHGFVRVFDSGTITWEWKS